MVNLNDTPSGGPLTEADLDAHASAHAHKPIRFVDDDDGWAPVTTAEALGILAQAAGCVALLAALVWWPELVGSVAHLAAQVWP